MFKQERNNYNIFFKFSNIHIFEPVPQFYHELKEFWISYKNSFGWNSQTYNYGLGSSDRSVTNHVHSFV